MASLVDIYNIVLGDLGSDLVADPQQLTIHAQVLAARYPMVRDYVSRAYPWNCLVRRTVLPALSVPPAFGWRWQYQLPADPFCLRALDIGAPLVKWKVEGRVLLTDKPAPVTLRYIARIEDTELFDPGLVEAIASRLAMECAWKITKKARADELAARYKANIAEARAVDAQEGWPDDAFFESEILTAIDGGGDYEHG